MSDTLSPTACRPPQRFDRFLVSNITRFPRAPAAQRDKPPGDDKPVDDTADALGHEQHGEHDHRAEQQQLLRGGKLRALGMLIPDSFEVEGLGTIPSSFDSYPGLSEYLPISQAIGFAVPADAPAEAKSVLVDAFNKAMATDKVKNWAKENYYLLSGKTGAESKAVFDALESNFAWTLWELGAATVNPEKLGIPKP